ncbi:MAG: hypothetical protein IT548_03460 [Alphaproteobacteria bacterium]|nr:hypothetical protein [Alphaproteobacteria bacterium]
MENEWATPENTPPDQALARRRRGGQPGNRNALRSGRETAEARIRRKQRLALARDIRALLGHLRPPAGESGWNRDTAAPVELAAGDRKHLDDDIHSGTEDVKRRQRHVKQQQRNVKQQQPNVT